MKLSKKILCSILALVMVICMIPATSLAKDKNGKAVSSLAFATMSDIHYYPQYLTMDENGNKSDTWYEDCRSDAKEYDESEDIVKTALATLAERAKENGTKYLLLSGDLTRNSEYYAHVGLAEMMKEFEEESGVKVIAINGNHDINSARASSYKNGVKEEADSTSPQQFREIYADLGYDLATSEYGVTYVNGEPVVEKKANALSYTVDLDEKTQLIVIDSCIYPLDEVGKAETGGEISPECMEWICQKADEATAQGRTNLVMVHHNIAPHMECEPSVTFAFCINDYLDVAETFAAHNIHYTFTGHLHQADIATVINDDGQILYDCESGSLTSYPNTYREMNYTVYENGEGKMDYENVDFDAAAAYVHNGKTYAQGEFKKESFGLCFGGALGNKDGVADMVGFVKGLYNGYAKSIFKDITAAGGLVGYLKSLHIDLEQIIKDFLEPYIGEGFYINGKSVVSAENIMWFINDLSDQIQENYINDPDKLWSELEPCIRKLANTQLSEIPCTKLIDEIGIGDPNKGGTLEDVLFTAVYYFYTGNEDISDDLFLQDVIEQFKKGVTEIGLFDAVMDVVFNDILDGLILKKLEVRLDKLFADDDISQKAAEGINYLMNYVLRGNFSYSNLVNTIFALGILPYTSIYDILDKLLIQEYYTESQDESIGRTFAYFINDFATDSDPMPQGDYGVSYYSTDVEVPVNTKNYRKPTMISVTMGDDSQTSAYINWFSKSTLEAADIEIKKVGTDSFSGNIEKTTELVERYYPGIDLGAFGLFNYYFDMYRHTIKLTNLEPGTKYEYRVGNAERGWWSDTGVIETADGSNNVTFFHLADPQAQSEEQYTRGWAHTIDKAFELYPDAKFIACTGDMVDYGMNSHMWQWMFDTASDHLQSTYLMPTTGNHEEKDDYSTVGNFALPNVPDQDTKTGVYYSYDYNNVHFAVLNTNDLNDDESLSDKQVEWLKKDMEASDAQWKIVVLHKALYSNGSHYDDDDVVAMRSQLGSLMPDLGIDVVLQGHDHVYLRTTSLDSNQVVEEKVTYLKNNGYTYKTYDDPTGIIYEIAGCSGVKFYQTKDVTATDELFPRAEKIVDAYTNLFTAFQIKDGVLYYNAYLVDGENVECIDTFAIRKDATQGDELAKEDWPTEQQPTDETPTTLSRVFALIMKVIKVVWNIYQIYIVGILDTAKIG